MFWQRLKNIIKIKLESIGNREGTAEKQRSRRRDRANGEHAAPSNYSKEAKYFKLLEMEPTQDLELIKSQYRKLIRKYHPDRHHNEEDKRLAAEKLSIALNEAVAYFEEKLS